jgi:hypothetical protein
MCEPPPSGVAKTVTRGPFSLAAGHISRSGCTPSRPLPGAPVYANFDPYDIT